MEDTILVSYVEPTNGDIPVLIVGRKSPGEAVTIINAFQGDEAMALYNSLITKKEANKE